MNTVSKERQGCDVICKNHTARAHPEKDAYRICPSKLNKRELEDLYFALLENNVELKKTIHSQQDKLKMLNTKLQRMTSAQRNAAGKEKEGGATKALINEQKETILEMKKANERLSERIRVLNMRLCSAKQFLKRSPSQNIRCMRCITAPTNFKNSSMSALNSKPSESNMKMTSTSCQHIKEHRTPVTNDAQTETDELENDGCEKQCNENKCRSQMDKLKEKVVDLQEELSKAHKEYTHRISKLEDDVSALNNENTRVRATSQHELDVNNGRIRELRDKLNQAEASCNDLALQLTIEKRKVAELETSLKLATLSDHMAKTIEKLAALTQEKLANAEMPSTSPRSDGASQPDAPHKKMLMLNEEMSRRVSELQEQLDNLRDKTAGEYMDKLPSRNSDENKDYFTPDEEKPNTNDKDKQFPINSSILEIELVQDDLTNDKDLQPNVSEYDSEKPGSSREARKVSINLNDNDEDNIYYTRNKRHQSAISTYTGEPTYDSKNKSDPKDDHNRFQIPGPIPISPTKYKNPSKTKKDKKKKPQTDEKSVTIGGIKNIDNLPNKHDSFDIDKNNMKQDDIKTEKVNAKNDTNNHNSCKKDINPLNYPDEPSKRQNSLLNDLDFDSAKSEANIYTDKEYEPKIFNETSDESNEIGFNGTRNTNDEIYPESKLYFEALRNKRDQKVANVNDQIFDKPKTFESRRSTDEYRRDPNNVDIIDGNDRTFYEPIPFEAGRRLDEFDPDTNNVPNVDANDQTFDEPKPNESRRKSNEYKRDSKNMANVMAHDQIFDEPKLRTKSNELESKLNLNNGRNVDDQIAESYKINDTNPTKERKESLHIGKIDSIEISKRRFTNDKNTPHTDELQQIQEPNSSFANPSDKIPADINGKTYIRQSIDDGKKADNDFQGSQIDPKDPTKPPSRDSATYTKSPLLNVNDQVPNTYTLDKRDMATSPDNTDHEISSITDQPQENEIFDTPVRDVLSPGEQKASTPRTETQTSHTDYGSLSEGELPTTSKARSLSAGERPLPKQMSRKSSLQMEATLEAISRELERCRRLLVDSRPQETNTESRRDEVPLHRTTASRRLPYTKPHTCVFTLHIGTLVLSDKAVMQSRDKSLVLMWKFYDQNVSMARLRPGRVILFDFSTQYDVPFSEDFLNYMKHEDMPLMICEMNNQDKPIATCSLPLKGALLHTNRRADMSLALLSKTSHEELGVLDLWCALRAAPALRPRLTAQYNAPKSQSVASISETSYKSQTVANGNTPPDSRDEHSDTRLSQDIAFDGGRRKRDTFPSNTKAIADSLQDLVNREKNVKNMPGLNKMSDSNKKSVKYRDALAEESEPPVKLDSVTKENDDQSIEITVLWLALNEECEAMLNPNVRRVYVAYSFLGRHGADLETPVSLPKPKHYADKCFFDFKKTFQLHDADLPLLGHMSRCRAGRAADPRDCIVFSVVSEPPEDPLGLSSCEDIG